MPSLIINISDVKSKQIILKETNHNQWLGIIADNYFVVYGNNTSLEYKIEYIVSGKQSDGILEYYFWFVGDATGKINIQLPFTINSTNLSVVVISCYPAWRVDTIMHAWVDSNNLIKASYIENTDAIKNTYRIKYSGIQSDGKIHKKYFLTISSTLTGWNKGASYIYIEDGIMHTRLAMKITAQTISNGQAVFTLSGDLTQLVLNPTRLVLDVDTSSVRYTAGIDIGSSGEANISFQDGVIIGGSVSNVTGFYSDNVATSNPYYPNTSA